MFFVFGAFLILFVFFWAFAIIVFSFLVSGVFYVLSLRSRVLGCSMLYRQERLKAQKEAQKRMEEKKAVEKAQPFALSQSQYQSQLFYLSVCLPARPPAHPSVFCVYNHISNILIQPIYPPVHLAIHPPIHLSTYSPIHPSVRPSVRPSIQIHQLKQSYPSICNIVHPSEHPSVRSSIYLSTDPAAHSSTPKCAQAHQRSEKNGWLRS